MNSFEEWVFYGIEKGWILEPTCDTHDGANLRSEEEWEQFENGEDPCVVVIRVLP